MRRLLSVLCLVLTAALCAPTTLAQQRGPADRTAPTEPVFRGGALVLTVDNAFDEPDDNPGDGICATSFSDCTLRAAINEANAQPNTQPVDIEFNIGFGPDGAEIAPGVWRIQPNFDSGSGAFGRLPDLAQPGLRIDGETQPGASCGDLVGGVKHDLRVVLNGDLQASDNGLQTSAFSINNYIVRGLVVQNFPGRGLNIDDVGATGLVECNYIGTDFTGELDRGNGDDGLKLKGTAQNNLISGNGDFGVDLDQNSTLSRNLIGSDADGNQPLGNDDAGITTIGDRDDIIISTNLVSANGGVGILVNGGERVELTNNTVGLTKNRGVGPGGMGNADAGILVLNGATDLDIGLPGAGQGNFAGNNGGSGILVEGENTSDVRIRGNTVGLTFNGNAAPNLFGIVVGTTFNARGSDPGADAAISARSGPGSGPVETVIGGPSAGEGNLVAGNSFAGLILATDISTLVEGNTIGLNDSGAARPNGTDGLILEQSASPTIRGNVISSNGGDGIDFSPFGGETTGSLIENNTIGLNASGATRGNGGEGIFVRVSFDPVIRGNTVSGNGGSGIRFESQVRGEGMAVPAPEGGTRGGIVIDDNRIGTTADGSAARPNVESGLVLTAATPGVTVTGNTISGNTDTGIFLAGGTFGHVFENNFIGTNASGANLGNGIPGNDGLAGIFCQNASGVRIGQNFQPNTIRFNGKDGIFLAAACQDISIVGNIISDNGELAVDLAPNGPNPNDVGDGDAGANEKLNFPVVTSAENDGANSVINWSLNARPNTTYELLFCRNAAPDPSGFGECQNPNALTTTTTNGSGNASGTRTLGVGAYPAGSFVSVNATKVDGALPAGYRETSEFGAAVEVDDTSAPGEVTIDATPTSPLTVPRGGQVSFTYTVMNGTNSPATGQSWFSAALGGNTVAEGVITDGTLPAGQQVTINYVQNVPNNAPIASYDFCLRIGLFPSPFIDEDCFVVTVTPARVAGGGDEWSVSEVSPWAPEPMDSGTETADAEAASSAALPETVELSGAYPNPFSGRATVAFGLPEAGRVTVSVYDVLGREVAVLVDGDLPAGRHEAVLDGSGLPAGVYLVRLAAGSTVQTQQLTLVR